MVTFRNSWYSDQSKPVSSRETGTRRYALPELSMQHLFHCLEISFFYHTLRYGRLPSRIMGWEGFSPDAEMCHSEKGEGNGFTGGKESAGIRTGRQ